MHLSISSAERVKRDLYLELSRMQYFEINRSVPSMCSENSALLLLKLNISLSSSWQITHLAPKASLAR